MSAELDDELKQAERDSALINSLDISAEIKDIKNLIEEAIIDYAGKKGLNTVLGEERLKTLAINELVDWLKRDASII